MPNPEKIDPNLVRERGLFETDEQYSERMKKLGKRDEFIAKLLAQSPTSGEQS